MAMPSAGLDFHRLRTPPQSGDVLVEPVPTEIRRALDAAREAFSQTNVAIAGRDLRSLRGALRRQLLGGGSEDVREKQGVDLSRDREGAVSVSKRGPLPDPDGGRDDSEVGCPTLSEALAPLVVLGHQPEFLHPGVWAKNVVACRLADACGGWALNLIVDTDAPKQTDLLVPVSEDSPSADLRLETVHVFDMPPGASYECVPRLPKAAIEDLTRALRARLGPRYDRSLLGDYLAAMAATRELGDFVDQTVAGCAAINRRFGLNLVEHRVSRAWQGPLLAEMLANASRFFECYNAALHDYRQALGLRGSARPVPDLLRQGERFELPVWVGQPDGAPTSAAPGTNRCSRRRLFLEQRRGSLQLFADQRPLGRVCEADLRSWDTAAPALDSLGSVQFRPRALTLTLWARLLLADLFIHGIGGAKYDRITDRLIERYFGMAPPPIACVSATLRLDLPRHDASPEMRRRLRHERRDLGYNPQRHLDLDESLQALANARADAVRRSDLLRATARRDAEQRRRVFHDIRRVGAAMLEARPEAARALRQRLRQVEAQLQDNAVADRRDYFFALFDAPALQRLCDHLPATDAFRI